MFSSSACVHEVGLRVKSDIDFTTNYCGAYWSAGKFQSSVEDSQVEAVSPLDEQCRLHDRAYARNEDRVFADQVFYNNTNNLGLRGKIYGRLVYHGNKSLRMIAGILGAPIGSRNSLDDKQNKNNVQNGVSLRGSVDPLNHMPFGSTPVVNNKGGLSGTIVYDPSPDLPELGPNLNFVQASTKSGASEALNLTVNSRRRRKKFRKRKKKIYYG
jgi:hypothetical protein